MAGNFRKATGSGIAEFFPAVGDAAAAAVTSRLWNR
jgi:hypothetical protein